MEQSCGYTKAGYLVALLTTLPDPLSEHTPLKGLHSISKWKVRWFELRNNELYCFTDCSKQTPLAIIAMNSVVITEINAPGRPFCFKLETSGSSCFLQAANAIEADEWLAILRERSLIQSEAKSTNFLLYEIELKPPVNLKASQEMLSFVSNADTSVEEQNKTLKAMIISQQRKYRKLDHKLRSLVAYHRHEHQIAMNTKANLEIWINDLNVQLETARLRNASLAIEHKLQSDQHEMSEWFVTVSLR